MPIDRYPLSSDQSSDPAREVFAITTHNTNELAIIPKAIRCDVAGTVALRTVGSTADISITMAAGEILPVRAQYIRATGTTATLHGLA